METVGRIACTTLWLFLSLALTVAGIALIRSDDFWLCGFGGAAIMFASDALNAARNLWKWRAA